MEAQQRMQAHRQSKIAQTPPILIVDGVWVDILYTLDEFKLDQAGHRRQVRQAQERVILAAIAIWPDGIYNLLHYEIAQVEDTESWPLFLRPGERNFGWDFCVNKHENYLRAKAWNILVFISQPFFRSPLSELPLMPLHSRA